MRTVFAYRIPTGFATRKPGNMFKNMTYILATKVPGPMPCVTRPSAPTVLHGFPEGRPCGALGVDGRRCMGAVCHPSLPQCLAQLPPGSVASDTGAGGSGHGQQYDEREVARAPYLRGHNPQCRIADSAIRHCRLAVHAAMCAWCPPTAQPMLNPLENSLGAVPPGTAPNEYRGFARAVRGYPA